MSHEKGDPANLNPSAGTPEAITEVQRQEGLLKTGALHKAIFNSAYFSSIATDEKGVIQIFNVGAEVMLGYAAADVVDKITPADISDPEEVIARAKALSAELSTPITPGFEALVFKASRGIEDIYELTYIRKDGTRFPAIVSVTALRDDQDAIIGYLLIGTDNSARKQAEEALLKAGALQKAIFNSAYFSSIATDEKGVIQIFNVGAEVMLGYAAADVVDKITPADISDPEEVIARAKALSAELSTPITPGFEALVFKASRGIEDIYELTYIRKDGSRFPAIVSVTALRDDQDAIIGYLLIGTDNSARKAVEADQKQTAQRLRDHQFYTRSLFESNIDALMTTDSSGIITDVNKQMEALTGCTRDELIGAPVKGYFTDPERAEAGIELVLRERKVNNYELTARGRDGKETVVSLNATTLYDRDRRLQGVFAAARDVTERKLMEETLETSRHQLRQAQKMEAVGQLAGGVAHDFNNILQAMLSLATVLRLRSNSPEMATAVADIDSLIKRGADLTRQLLIFARREITKKEQLDLSELVRAAVRLLRQILPENTRLTCETAPEPLWVQGDVGQIHQIIVNLAVNARDAMPEGGTLAIRAGRSNGEATLEVADTGHGMDEHTRAHIFEPFFTTKDKVTGSGVGLSVVYGIVEQHGGRIEVESAPGQGARFRIVFPMVSPPEEAVVEQPVGEEELPPGHGERILLVEDEDAARRSLTEILEMLGYQVTAFGSGEEAGALPVESAFDLLLTDMMLPGIAGGELARGLLKRWPKLKVILMSGYAEDEAVRRGALAGRIRFLQKPFDMATLACEIRAALEE